jgi:hypothetical protein
VYYTCKTCKHKALDAELGLLHLKPCTLCHAKIEEPTDMGAGVPKVEKGPEKKKTRAQ